MNLESHNQPSQTPASAPVGAGDPFPEFARHRATDDTVLNVTFSREHEPEAAEKKATVSSQIEVQAAPERSMNSESSKPSFFQALKEHFDQLNPWSKTSGAILGALAVSELLLAATCPVPGGPLMHLAFAGINSLLSYYYLSGKRDNLFRD